MPEIHLPEGMRYSCLQCGVSCRIFNEVAVDEASEARLASLDLTKLPGLELPPGGPIIDSPTQPGRRQLATKPGCPECVFLDARGRCGVHAAHGAEAKPRTCREFPFRYVETPHGLHVGLSFACTAVLANHGEPLADQRAALEEGAAHAAARLAAGPEARLHRRHGLSWAAAARVQAHLTTLLATPGHTVAECLGAQAVYMDILLELVRATRGGAATQTHGADAGREPDDAVVRAVGARYVDGPGRADLFRLAGRARHSPALQRAFLGMVTAFRHGLAVRGGAQRGRAAVLLRIVGHYLAHVTRLGRVRLTGMPGAFGHGAFRQVDATMESPECQELLGRYFRHVIERQDLLLAASMWVGHRLVLMHHGLVRWYAVGFAHAARRPTVGRDEVAAAIREVEKHYGFHTPFGELFEKNPALGLILDSLMEKPHFAAAMLGMPVGGGKNGGTG